MKNLVAFALILFLGISLNAQKREIEVGDFTKISFATSGTMYLTQGNENKVVIDASDEAMERIVVEGSGSRLVIKTKSGSWNWKNWDGGNITAYVTVRKLEDLDVSGSGVVEGKGRFDSGEMDLSVSGSGSMDLDVDADAVDIDISGSGKIYLGGKADSAKASISGSGKVKADDFVVNSFRANISGSGSCYITANEEIDADVSGSGNVYYKGNPRKLNSHSSGSGGIKRM